MKIVLCYSGGLDSTVLLSSLKSEGHFVNAFSVDYGQRHVKELSAANALCDYYQVQHEIADLSGLRRSLFAGSSQTSSEIAVPEGHYAEESMKQTVVPNRNMVLLALATALAVSRKYDAVAFAAHTGDHAIYPDCRPEFAEAMEDAIRLCDWHSVKLIRPFLYPTPMSKTDIIKLGNELQVPFHRTWSCYKGQQYHCGVCGTCVERKEAFEKSGVTDPTVYLTDHLKEQ